MTRQLYRWIILLHPAQFRRRFGDEILCIFDEAGAGAALALLGDGIISLLRQRALRSVFPLVLAALLGAAVQIIFGGFVWLEATHRMAAASVGAVTGTQTPREAGMFLLLIAAAITAILSGSTALAVWSIRFCARKGGHEPGRMAGGANRTARATLVTLAVAICLLKAPLTQGQSPAARPEFEVASVKLNTSGCNNGRGGGRGGAPQTGRLSIRCITLRDLIQAAYGTFAGGGQDQRLLQVLGAPGWVESDVYDIEATPTGSATIPQMYGPMLQGLLEDRFRLKIHRETREFPVYALTIAKSGLKLRASAEGSCTPLDLNRPPAQPAPGQPAPPPFCGRSSFRRSGESGERMSVEAFGLSMASFAGTTLSTRLDLDRPVIDKTGLGGIYDIHLEFSAGNVQSGNVQSGGGIPAPSADSAPSLFTAVQEQLGLKLSPEKAPVDVLVVDSIARPSGN